MGKRVVPHFFLEEILGDEGLHACLYLVTVDMAGEVLQGFEFAGWRAATATSGWSPTSPRCASCPGSRRPPSSSATLADEESGAPIEETPRQILKRQIERATKAGYTAKLASELEFYAFRDTYEELADCDCRDARPTSSCGIDYTYSAPPYDEWLIRQIRNDMLGAGIPIEFSKGESGRGQHEINLTYSDALDAADNHAIFKHGMKEIAMLSGAAVTFMAKWSMAEAGSSFHLHSSLWNDDGSTSLMWDAEAPDHQSETFRHFLGGLMATAREMSIMFAPFVNSYKRYQLGSWAPTAIVWGPDNRTLRFSHRR